MKLKIIKKNAKQLLATLFILLLTSQLFACHEEDQIDFRAPSLTIDSPTPGTNVPAPSVTITGTVSDDVISVELSIVDDMGDIIGSPVPGVLAGTSFSGSLTLSTGDNFVKVMVRDEIGNRNSITFNLHYAQLDVSDGVADIVIGQEDFTSNSANRGSTPTANTLSGVQGTLYEKELTTLYIPDTGNHRILGFDAVPATDGVDANFVLGQVDLTSNSSGVSATEFTSPTGIYTTNTQMFVTDSGNNRVLIWDSHPTNNTVAAAHVMGQLDFTSSATGCSSSTLSGPASVFVVDEKVIVLDRGNHRLLIWNSIPDADGVAADVVVGQVGASAMDTCLPNDSDGNGATDTASASTLNNPSGMWSDGERLLIADTNNHRVLVWDTFPTTNGQAADWVIGQADMVSSGANSLNGPLSVTSNRVQIFVANSGNTSVLIFSNFPTMNNMPADSVLGPNFDYDVPTPGLTTSFTSVDNVYVDRSRLFVVDTNRVLIFNTQ